MPSVAPAVSGGMHTAICDVTGGSCGAQAAQARPPRRRRPPPRRRPDLPAGERRAPNQDLCGSSYFNVPELWFTPACANHDRCYGAHQGKAACDTAFLNDMLAICAKLPSSGSVNANFTRASCRAAARLYYKGVVSGAASPTATARLSRAASSSHRLALVLDQDPAQDLACRRAGDRVDEAHRADALVGRDARRHPRHDVLRLERLAGHDHRDGCLAGGRVRTSDDRGVGDRRCVARTASSSAGATWKAMTLISSLSRSTTKSWASSSTTTRSPVRSHRSASIIAAVASARCR